MLNKSQHDVLEMKTILDIEFLVIVCSLVLVFCYLSAEVVFEGNTIDATILIPRINKTA